LGTRQLAAGLVQLQPLCDYLPFFACMLLKAAADPPYLGKAETQVDSTRFRVVNTKRYTAVFGLPAGLQRTTYASPMPVRVANRFSVLRAGGREDRASRAAPPAPCHTNGRRLSFRDCLRYRLTEDGLLGSSPLARHERRFRFAEDGFECLDEITFRRRCSWPTFIPANFLFRTLRRSEDSYVTWHGAVRARVKMAPEGSIQQDAAVTASGHLVALRHAVEGFKAAPGQRTTVRLTVEFL